MAKKALLVMMLAVGFSVTPAQADERVDSLVAALREDPVVVSSAMVRAVPAADIAALRRTVAAAPVAVFVVIAPSFAGEPGLETLRPLPDLLHDGLGREGIYVAVDQQAFAYAQTFGVQPRFELGGLLGVVAGDRPGARPAQAARYAVQLLSTGRRTPAAARQQPQESRSRTLPVLVAGLGAGGLGFVVVGWPWLVGGRRRAAAAARPAQAALCAPVDPQAVREQALEELADLSAALAAAGAPPAAAFDSYAAASKVLQEHCRPIDLVAALELARRGRAELRGAWRAPCFFDPRHGAGTRRTRWRLGREDTDLPACRRCAGAVAKGRVPAALEDRGRPYFERDTLWARTGLGAIDGDLPARVLAGEQRR